jgi:uncharacterized membrane protein YgdD (TMEM256/DUF423 family)
LSYVLSRLNWLGLPSQYGVQSLEREIVTPKLVLILASLFGASAVAAGAFGAHGLRGTISDRALEIFETATRYQLTHALLLLAIALLMLVLPDPPSSLPIGAVSITVGMVLFCGSLYGLSLGAARWFGAIAPLGGAAFIVGWLCVAIAAWKLT